MMPQDVIDILTSNIDTLWVIDCAILVFIMQAGFMCMETGLSRHKNSINVTMDFLVPIYFSLKQIKRST